MLTSLSLVVVSAFLKDDGLVVLPLLVLGFLLAGAASDSEAPSVCTSSCSVIAGLIDVAFFAVAADFAELRPAGDFDAFLLGGAFLAGLTDREARGGRPLLAGLLCAGDRDGAL